MAENTMTSKDPSFNADNEKAILSWRGPAKETKSARLRREMNAGKGGRMRSLTSSTDDINKEANDWIRNRLFEQKKQISQLEDQSDALQKANIKLKAVVSSHETTLQKQTEQIEEYTKKLESKSNLEGDMKRFRTKASSLESEVNKLKSEKIENETLLTNLKTKLNEREEQLKELTDRFLEKEEFYKQKLDSCHAKQRDLNKDVEKFVTLTTEQREQINILKNHLSKGEYEQRILNRKIVELESTCKGYEHELAGRLKENSSIMLEQEKMKELISQQNERIEELVALVDKRNTQLTYKENECNELSEIRSKMEIIIASEKAEVEKLRPIIEELKNEIDDLKKKSSIKSKEQDDDLKELQILMESNSASHERMKDKLECKIESLKRELDELQVKNSLLEKECEEERCLQSQIITQNDKHKQQVEDLKENLLNSVKGMNEKAQLADRLFSENAVLKEKISQFCSMVEDNKALKEEVENLKAARHCYQNECEAQVSDLKASVEENLKVISVLNGKLEESKCMLEEKVGFAKKLEKDFQEILNERENRHLENLKAVNSELSERQRELEESKRNEHRYDTISNELRERCTEKELAIKKLEEELQSVSEGKNQLELKLQEQEQELLKLRNSRCHEIEKQRLLFEEKENQYSHQINSLQDELDRSFNNSKEEIDELLNNFTDLENELSFCHVELNSKSEELTKAQEELCASQKMFMMREEKLKKEMESLNEQKKDEIQKLKNRENNLIEEMNKQNEEQLKVLQDKFEWKLEDWDRDKQLEILKIKTSSENEILKAEFEKEQALEKLKINEDLMLKETKAAQLSEKAKTVEVDAKSRVIAKLGQRISVQQRLITCLMKSLAQERGHQSPGETKNEKNVEDETTGWSDVTSLLSRGCRGETRIELKEKMATFQTAVNEEKLFAGGLASNDIESSDGGLMDGIVLPGETDESACCSPVLKSEATCFYFCEQMKFISDAFTKIEQLDSLDCNEKFNLEIWKQKIHYRLKILEDQMSGEDSCSSYSADSMNSYRNARSDDGSVVFHPTNDQIRDLIENVNHKYYKYYKTPSPI